MSEEAKMYTCSWCGKATAYIEDIKYCPFCGEEL